MTCLCHMSTALLGTLSAGLACHDMFHVFLQKKKKKKSYMYLYYIGLFKLKIFHVIGQNDSLSIE